MVKDRETWRALVHGVTKSLTWLNNNDNTVFDNNYCNKETIDNIYKFYAKAFNYIILYNPHNTPWGVHE